MRCGLLSRFESFRDSRYDVCVRQGLFRHKIKLAILNGIATASADGSVLISMSLNHPTLRLARKTPAPASERVLVLPYMHKVHPGKNVLID